MLISVGDSILNIQKVYSAIIWNVYEDKKVCVSGGFLGLFPTFKNEKVFDKYELKVEYDCMDGKRYIYSSTHSDRKVLEKYTRDMITQIKGFDNELVTAALENALFGKES
jgi:hypothetical protein